MTKKDDGGGVIGSAELKAYPIHRAMRRRLFHLNALLANAKQALEDEVELAREIAGAPEGFVIRDINVGFEYMGGEPYGQAEA